MGSNFPLVLNIEALVAAAGSGVMPDSISPSVIAILTAHIAKGSASETFTPIENKETVGVVVLHFVGDSVYREAALEVMLLTSDVCQIGSIQVNVVPGRDVKDGIKRARDVLEARGLLN